MTDQKLTKAAEKTLDAGHLHTYVRTWGLKRWEGICLKRRYVQELTVHILTITVGKLADLQLDHYSWKKTS